MNHWPFIIAAYALTLAGGAGMLVWSFLRMRASETLADNLRNAQ